MEENSQDSSWSNSTNKGKPSLILRCGFFTVLYPETPNKAVSCNMCKKDLRGPQTSNFLTHLRVRHPHQYNAYQMMKHGEVPEPGPSQKIEIEEPVQENVKSRKQNILFSGGFFEFIETVDGTKMKSYCLACRRLGKENCLLSFIGTTSNLITHLNRIHHDEYERYMNLKKEKQHPSSLGFDPNELSIQSVESLVKSEDLEFVDVSQDDGFELENDWSESIDSENLNDVEDDFENYELDSTDAQEDEPIPFNRVQIKGEPDEIPLSHPTSVNRSILFRNNFFRFIDSDDKIMRAECLQCGDGTIRRSSVRTTSNFVCHLRRIHPESYQAYKEASGLGGRRADVSEALPVQHTKNETDDSMEASTSNTNPACRYNSVLFRKNFFRFIDTDDKVMRAECLLCGDGTIRKTSARTTSNYVIHLKRIHPKAYLAYKEVSMYGNMAERIDQEREEIYSLAMKKRFNQIQFNRIVMDFMIHGMHPPSLLKDQSFVTLLNDIATHRTDDKPSKIEYPLISVEDLNAKVNEMVTSVSSKILTELASVDSISVTVDICSVQGKNVLAVTANWIEPNGFARKSRLISCDTFDINESISRRLEKIYKNYGIEKKILATVTSNMMKDIAKINDGSDQIKNIQIYDQPGQIPNPTHIFELIGTEDAEKALNDLHYSVTYRQTIDKVNALQDTLKFDLKKETVQILENIFEQPTHGCVAMHGIISKLIDHMGETLNGICEELNVPFLIDADFEFLKEFNMILEPIVNAIEYLERPECYFAAYLPMVHSTKDSLCDLKTNGNIQYCEPLLTAILNGVDERFAHFFNLHDDRCNSAVIATCTHPFFKTRWLKGDLDTPMNNNHISHLLLQATKQSDAMTKDGETSVKVENPNPPQKKFKFSFETAKNTRINDGSVNRMDLMAFLKKPCPDDEDDLEQIRYHPCVQKLFMQFNSIPCSSTLLMGTNITMTDLIRKAQSRQFDDKIFGKLSLLNSDASSDDIDKKS